MITERQVIKFHEKLEILKLCKLGILHLDLLESAIAGKQWYESTFDKYVHVASSINSDHIFNDETKELAIWLLRSYQNMVTILTMINFLI